MRTRWLPVVGVLVLSPVCAEYLSAYDVSAAGLVSLLAGLLVLAPLYGAPALLAREVAVRRDLGWPGLLLLVTAMGVVQAVVVDQSVVNPDYRGFDGWAELWRPTYVEALDLSAYAAVAFVLGHAVASSGAPLALVGVLSLDGGRAWLGRWTVVGLGGLYLAAAGVVLADHVASEGWQLSGPQLAGALGLVVLLVVAALRVPARTGSPVVARSTPPPVLLVLVGVVVESALGWSIVWPALAATLVGLVVLALALVRWGRSPDFSAAHVACLALGVLLSRALGGFLVEPVEGGRTPTTLLVNLGAVLLVAALAVLARRRLRACPRSPSP